MVSKVFKWKTSHHLHVHPVSHLVSFPGMSIMASEIIMGTEERLDIQINEDFFRAPLIFQGIYTSCQLRDRSSNSLKSKLAENFELKFSQLFPGLIT